MPKYTAEDRAKTLSKLNLKLTHSQSMTKKVRYKFRKKDQYLEYILFWNMTAIGTFCETCTDILYTCSILKRFVQFHLTYHLSNLVIKRLVFVLVHWRDDGGGGAWLDCAWPLVSSAVGWLSVAVWWLCPACTWARTYSFLLSFYQHGQLKMKDFNQDLLCHFRLSFQMIYYRINEL